MLKIFDEKMNGFLFTIILPPLVLAMSYYGFESSYTRLKTAERLPDYLFSSVYAYRVILNYLSLYLTGAGEYVIDHYHTFFRKFLLKNGTAFYHSLFFVLYFLVFDKMLKVKSIAFLHFVPSVIIRAYYQFKNAVN